MNTLARVAFAAALIAVAPMSTANAVCNVEIYAERAYSSGSLTYLYGRRVNTDTFQYSASTTNPTLAALIFAATAQHSKVFVQGNAGVCPAAGAIRHAGSILYAFMSP